VISSSHASNDVVLTAQLLSEANRISCLTHW